MPQGIEQKLIDLKKRLDHARALLIKPPTSVNANQFYDEIIIGEIKVIESEIKRLEEMQNAEA
jgi:hypothetical protein